MSKKTVAVIAVYLIANEIYKEKQRQKRAEEKAKMEAKRDADKMFRAYKQASQKIGKPRCHGGYDDHDPEQVLIDLEFDVIMHTNTWG